MNIAFFTIRMKKGFGVDLVVDRWARALDARTHRVTVYCFDQDPETFSATPYKIAPMHLSNDKANKFLPFFEADAGKTLKKLDLELKPPDRIDIAIPASFPFYGAGKILGVPTIHLHFGNPPTEGLKLITRLNRLYLNSSDIRHMKHNEQIITISRFLKDRLPPRIQRKTEIVYPGGNHLPIPDDSLANAVKSMHRGQSEPPLLILCVSRLDYDSHPYKGVLELAETVEAVRNNGHNVRLVLAGIGTARSIEILRKLGAIVFESPEPNELAALYKLCDVYATLSRWEGFGLPVVEAAFARLPTVAFNSTAHRETAVTCPVESISDARQMLEVLVCDPEKRADLGNKAFELAQKFDWRESEEEFARIVEKFISKAR
ncbi:glycosyltransferase family 4 protein [bacterium]|nr:glycosyltransferase family 4 protein [bacterium]